jgi:hypothetical protein
MQEHQHEAQVLVRVAGKRGLTQLARAGVLADAVVGASEDPLTARPAGNEGWLVTRRHELDDLAIASSQDEERGTRAASLVTERR